MNYDDFLGLAQKRRSIRKFKRDLIPDDYVDKMIEVARLAPSGANCQSWEFIVIKKQEIKDRILEFIGEQNDFVRKVEVVREPRLRFNWSKSPPGFVAAPVWIIVCGDLRTKEAYPLNTMVVRGDSHFVSGQAIAFTYLSLAATSLGLGVQWVSSIALNHVQTLTKDLLKVPKEIVFYDMMAVGYPDIEPRPKYLRDRQEMVHYDGFDLSKYRTDDQVKDFIARIRT